MRAAIFSNTNYTMRICAHPQPPPAHKTRLYRHFYTHEGANLRAEPAVPLLHPADIIIEK